MNSNNIIILKKGIAMTRCKDNTFFVCVHIINYKE